MECHDRPDCRRELEARSGDVDIRLVVATKTVVVGQGVAAENKEKEWR